MALKYWWRRSRPFLQSFRRNEKFTAWVQQRDSGSLRPVVSSDWLSNNARAGILLDAADPCL